MKMYEAKGALYTYLQTKVDMGRVNTVADYRCFSSEFDFIYWALLHMALSHHFSADVFLSVETECDLLLVPRLELTIIRQDIKHLQTKEREPVTFTTFIFLFFYFFY